MRWMSRCVFEYMPGSGVCRQMIDTVGCLLGYVLEPEEIARPKGEQGRMLEDERSPVVKGLT